MKAHAPETAMVGEHLALPRIVIVGGGAGGLELASRLGHRLGRRGRVHVTLIDATLTHLWKPLLHEVAAGTLDSHDDDLDYLAQGRWRHFDFRLGRLVGIDRERKRVRLAPTFNADGAMVTPARTVPYDLLVVAIGSVTNDLGIAGVREHCTFLDSRADADRFQRQLLESYLRVQTQNAPLVPGQLHIAVVGAGATGIELAAELHNVARLFVAYGFDRIVPDRDVKISIIEAADRLLPALPERLAESTTRQLEKLNITLLTGKRIARVAAGGLHTEDGGFIPAQMKVWAAGVKAPDFLRDIAGLETNKLNQLVVRRTLQTTRDDDIYAFGDCASCPRPGQARPVPPTAQAANQQARLLARGLARRLRGEPLPRFTYRDYGSLVSLGEYTTIGNLMGNLTGDIRLEGRIARLLYRSLYRRHQRALFGTTRTALLVLADILTRPTRPRTKLH